MTSRGLHLVPISPPPSHSPEFFLKFFPKKIPIDFPIISPHSTHSMKTISELRSAVRTIGFTEIAGTPAHTSQFGQPYIAVVNGHFKEEGAAARRESVEDALKLSLYHFKALWERGYKVIVWRVEPEIDEKNERTQVYFRFHPMRGVV